MRFLLAALTAFLFAVACYATAFAQGVKQTGPVTRGHASSWSTNGVVGDAGPAAAGNLKEIGITNAGLPFCINSAPITSSYYQLCMGAAANGATMITANAYGGATPQALRFNINSQNYDFPGNGQGNILGPNSSCVGCLAYFNNTSGTLTSSINALNLTQTTSGTTGGLGANVMSLTDTVAASGMNFYQALQIFHGFGGSTVTGGRNSLEVDSNLNAPTSSANLNRNYTSIYGSMAANSSDGGTGLSFGASKGGIFAGELFGHLLPAATNMLDLTGLNIDVAAEAGSSVLIKAGIQVTLHAFDGAVHGTLDDAAIDIGNGSPTSGTGWQTAILLSNDFGYQPMTTNGCVICTTNNNQTIATGIDLHHYTITGNFLQSTGFQVTGGGAVYGASFINPGVTSGLLASGSTTSAWTNNYTAGSREADFFNLDNAGGGFQWYQKTGSSAATLLATLDSTGALAVAAGITAPAGLKVTLATQSDTGPCAAGQIIADASYIYVCTATNTFKRAALSSY